MLSSSFVKISRSTGMVYRLLLFNYSPLDCPDPPTIPVMPQSDSRFFAIPCEEGYSERLNGQPEGLVAFPKYDRQPVPYARYQYWPWIGHVFLITSYTTIFVVLVDRLHPSQDS